MMDTENEFIKSEINKWGFDYIDDLLGRGYSPVQLVVNGKLRWWWVLNPTPTTNELLTDGNVCATLCPSRSVVSPVSTEMLTQAD